MHTSLKAICLGLAAFTAIPASAQQSPMLSSVPVLMRKQEADPAAKLALLREAIPALKLNTSKSESLKDRLRVSGGTWRLDVFGDGSGAEFSDAAAFERSHSTGIQPSQAMSDKALEDTGRAFVERSLSQVITLQPDERLVLAATSRRTEGGVSAKGTDANSAVVAQRVVFSREIGGIPVVGAGSKVTVTFLNDGSIESFRYDWPIYKRTSRVQATAAPIEVLRRLQRVSGVRAKAQVDNVLKAPSSLESITGPLKLGATVELQDLKCGYYDPGYAVRDRKAPVQTGCYYHVLDTRGEGDFVTSVGLSGAIPAGATYERDARWPEMNVLRGMTLKARKGGTAGSSKKIQPVPPRPDGPDQ